MDKQVIAVVLSFLLYVFYVLLPMIPSIVIYRMFPDTKVSASGVLANLNFKTTGAFAAYVVTVFLGFFLVKNTHELIAQIGNPVWTLKTNVELLNVDGSQYKNSDLLETLVVSVDPKLQRINGNKVVLSLPGNKRSWETTQLKFEIPNFGYKILDVSEISDKSKVNSYELILKLDEAVSIVADDQITSAYSGGGGETLMSSDAGDGPGFEFSN